MKQQELNHLKDKNKCREKYEEVGYKDRIFSNVSDVKHCEHICGWTTQAVNFKRPFTTPNRTFGTAVTAQLHTWPEGAA